MTERAVPAPAEVDTNALVYSGRAPSHTVMAARARRFGIWYYAQTVLLGMRAYLFTVLAYAVGQPLIYLIAMGLGLGALVSESVDGVDYLLFVAPALLISTIVMSVSGEMTYPVMSGFKWDRLYYGPAASAISPGQIALGHFLGVMIRFLFQATIFWLIMLAFDAAPGQWSWVLIPIGVLTAAAFGAPLQAYASTLTDEGFQFTFIQRFIVMPMFLFAGTFFPLSVMPVYLQWIGWISPIWHGTQLARVVSYGADLSLSMAVLHVSFLVGLTGLGLVWGVRSYTRRLSS